VKIYRIRQIAYIYLVFKDNRFEYSSRATHFANRIFGGCAPFVATWLGAVTHSNFAGIFYPIALAASTVIIGMIYLPETKGRALMD
jgi:hypothetical protein